MFEKITSRKWRSAAGVLLLLFSLLFLLAVPVRAPQTAGTGTATVRAGYSTSEDIIAQETDYYIKSLDVDITVQEDNVYNVVETYVFDFIQPHHGPVREIPGNHDRYYEDGSTSHIIAHVSDFKVTSPDANTDVSKEDGAYYIGSSDKRYIGESTYVMSYTYSIDSPDPIKGADELYYNIVGTGWSCPIAAVSWKITMPASFDAGKIGYSVGTFGSEGYDTNMLTSSVNSLVISGSYHTALYPYQGITIRCELPEGYFVFHSRSIGAWIAIGLLLLIPVVLILRNWKRSRRRVVPVVNFYPPKGMNPLDVEEIWDGETDHKIALIPYLADKGYIRIEELAVGQVSFRLTNNDFSALKPDERAFLQGMFPFDRKIGAVTTADNLKYRFYDTINRVGEMHQESRERQIRGYGLKYFLYLFAIVGMTLCPALYTAYVVYTDDMGCALWLCVMAVAAVILGGILVNRKKKFSSQRIRSIAEMILCAALLAVLFLLAMRLFSGPAALLMLATGCLNFLAAGCATYRTEENLKYYGDVLGYRNFIRKAELSQLQMLSRENPSYFYATMAYAYVFDLEKQWISQFEKYNIHVPEPTWYHGYHPFTYMTFMEDFGHVMQSSSVAMNAEPPSKSSGGGFFGGGFSGGGFSGGGSGGGGGGAW